MGTIIFLLISTVRVGETIGNLCVHWQALEQT